MTSPNYTAQRRQSGAGLVEYAPIMTILFLFVGLPLLDLVFVGYEYCAVSLLNQAQEASTRPPEQAVDPQGAVQTVVVSRWRSGAGRFVKIIGNPSTVVTFEQDATSRRSGARPKVKVQTTVVCEPLINYPLPWLQVPGLNCPMSLSVSSAREVKVVDNAAP